MSVYIIHPALTVPGEALAETFYAECKNELEQHLDVITVKTNAVMSTSQPGSADALIFFNRPDQSYDPALMSFFGETARAGAEVFPVALTLPARVPPVEFQNRQSFDVTEQLRQRDLTQANLATVATVFARIVVSRLQPTLSNERMRLFISHRRLDGEELAAAFHKQLMLQAQAGFRDLIDVRVGQDAQEQIETNLLQSDAVIFLDTPKTGESAWVARELELALTLNLPIIWVKIGSDDNRVKLRVVPAGKPHFELPDVPLSESAVPQGLADAVIHTAFRVSRETASRVFDQLRRLKHIAGEGKIHLAEVDRTKLLYSVKIPRKGFRYPQRPITHLIQFYGRWPKDDDESGFLPLICQLGYASHPDHGPVYDTALLVAPIPGQAIEYGAEKLIYVDSLDEYVNALEQYILTTTTVAPRRGLLISGAFPDSEPEFQQRLIDAVHTFVRATLERQGSIIFGGHPTFTPLVFEIARRRRPKDFKTAVRLYLSRYFVKDVELLEYEKSATVSAVESVDNDRGESLTKMRREMIGDKHVAGFVAIGGKTKAGGHTPGVDEEIRLAREAGLPVFLIGSAGGRAAEIGAELSAAGWVERINGLTAEQNQELLVSLDYGMLANMILKELKI